MFKPKNTLIALAVAMLVAACGGGGGGSPAPTGTKQTGNNTQQQQQQQQTPTNNTAAVTDANFNTQLTLVANQVLFNGSGQDLGTFQGTTTDPAAPVPGIYGQARGTNAPLQTFGLRLMTDPAVNVTGNGHIAIELVDASGAPQQLQLMIDQVNYAIDAAGKWTVSVPASAKLYVHGVSSAGTADVITTIPADAALVTLTDIVGDSTSHGLTVDIDKAVGLAKAQVASDAAKSAVLNTFGSPDFKGTFNMNAVYSALKINTQTGTDLGNPAAQVTVGGQAVKGAGVKGKFTPS